ncbi:MAG: hypothetical protein CVU89_12290 [Firmicutes bacterium HGW-Firmicutes-14]|nr:MAG: hypothetical protein CVU89_12290 [Firmicutes bacterium HGW-Firmicutes-14]
MNYAKLACVATCLLIFALLNTVSASEAPFKDVPETHWAYGSIQLLVKAGIIKGFPDNTFRPDLPVTREQFAVVIVKALNLPLNDKASQTFSDIAPDHWSFQYIDATKWFIPTPSDPKGPFNFNPNRAITREEVAEAAARALDLNKGPKPGENYLAEKFTDYESIAPEFRENTALAVYYGILAGNPDGSFHGKVSLTRAEMSVVTDNILKKRAAIKEGLKPLHKPWTIEFVNFERPDNDMVKNYPDYNKIQAFHGTVKSKVYGYHNSHLVVENKKTESDGNKITVDKKTVHAYIYEKDMDLFSPGDILTLNYDRDNNITSYLIQ